MLALEIPAVVKWKNADMEPEADLPIAYVTGNGKIGIFKTVCGKDWKWLRKKYNIVVWIYQNSLIPSALKEQ